MPLFKSEPRDVDTIRRDIATSVQKKLARSLVARHEELMGKKRDLVLPSKRLAVVEWYFGSKIEALTGDTRQFAEEVALGHVSAKIIAFDGNLDERVGAVDRETHELLLQHNAELAVALEIEADAFRDLVRPSYQSQGVEHELEDAPPLRVLKRHADRAREFTAAPYSWTGSAPSQSLRHFI